MKPSARASIVGVGVLLFVLMIAPGGAAAVTPTAQAGLRIHWQDANSSGLGKPQEFPASAFANGTYLLSSVPTGPGGRIWSSSDGLHWSVAWTGSQAPSFIVPGGPGFVAWASGILVSNNGTSWTQANAGVPQKLLNSDFPQLGSVAGTVVAFPDSGQGFWSADGHNWHSISGGPSEPVTLAGDGTNLWALTGGRGFGGTDSPVQLWVTSDGQHWTNTAQLPNSRRTSFLSAAFGPLGGVVIAGAKSWYSKDEVHWHVATNTPTLTAKGRDFIDDVVADESGFVAVAHRDPPGCVLDPTQRVALTWTSTDGVIWRKMSSKGWMAREIDQLFVNGRTLIGVGINWSLGEEQPAGVVWTAPLPIVASDTAPPPAPIAPPDNRGC